MRINSILPLMFCCFCINYLSSQSLPDDSKRDYYWKVGLPNFTNNLYGNYINFNEQPPTHGTAYLDYNLGNEIAGICDLSGNLLFNCNGTAVLDSTGHVMPHGDSINFGQAYINYHQYDGYPMFQGVIVLPKPMSASLYYIIHTKVNAFGTNALGLYYTLIDMNLNSGLGDVVIKNQPLITDSLQGGFITACRHGNGRDWWLLVPVSGEASYFRILLDPEGIHIIDKQYIGNPLTSKRMQIGKASFSPNGEFYVRGGDSLTGAPHLVDLYSFDRCTGLLSNYVNLSFDSQAPDDIIMSTDFSPDSKKLYIIEIFNVHQFNLTADNIPASRQVVATQDGFQWMGLNYTGFNVSAITPDNRIFIAAGATPFIHVINQPDSLGIACDLAQHSLLLSTQIRGLPNFPNFRLGRWIGSPCDVLVGVDNLKNNPVKISCNPNPVTDIASFELDMSNNNYSMKLEMYDLLSTKIGVVPISPFQSIIHYNTSNLSTGIYFAVLKKEGKILAKCKFIKE